MKAAVIAFISLLVLVFTGVIAYTIYGREIRKSELEYSMRTAMESTMEVLYQDNTYRIHNKDELIGDFMMNLCYQMDSNSNVRINILNVDYERGLLDIEAVQTYQNFIGKPSVITCRKTMIVESRQYAQYSGGERIA